jgi:hypothetical protein
MLLATFFVQPDPAAPSLHKIVTHFHLEHGVEKVRGRVARHPAAIRTGTSTTWLNRWAMYSRMSSGPSWSVERWKYCANYTPMSSEHGCERLSHDQPIVFSRP